MRVYLLTRKATNVSSRRLLESFTALGHSIEAVDPLACVLVAGADGVRVWRDQLDLGQADGVIPRFGPGLTEFGLSLLRHFEAQGIATLNSSRAILAARDKFRSLQVLAAAGVPVPRTVLARTADAPNALDQLEGESLVAKVLQGSQGTGVVLLSTRERAQRFLDLAAAEKQNILIQERVSGGGAREMRVFVVGGRVVAGMARKGGADFRSNLHLGGRGERLDVEEGIRDLALSATRAIGLDVAGVDVMNSSRGPLVLEVNPSPGIEGIEAVTGEDVAGAMASHFIDEICENAGEQES